MPYVALGSGPLSGAARQARDLAAADRWAALVSLRPELQPAVELQHELLGLVTDRVELIERGRLPRLSLPARYIAAKLQRGDRMNQERRRKGIPLPAGTWNALREVAEAYRIALPKNQT